MKRVHRVGIVWVRFSSLHFLPFVASTLLISQHLSQLNSTLISTEIYVWFWRNPVLESEAIEHGFGEESNLHRRILDPGDGSSPWSVRLPPPGQLLLPRTTYLSPSSPFSPRFFLSMRVKFIIMLSYKR